MFVRKFNHWALFVPVGFVIILVWWLILPYPKEGKAETINFMVFIHNGEDNAFGDDEINVWFESRDQQEIFFAGWMNCSGTGVWNIDVNITRNWTEWSVEILGREYIGMQPNAQVPNVLPPQTYLDWWVELL